MDAHTIPLVGKDDTMDKANWVRHTVSVPAVTRITDTVCRNKDGELVRKRSEVMVQVHDVYRRKVGDKADSVLWHRGAKVGAV
jgi:hypothetical protein